MKEDVFSSPYEVPQNSISVFYARVCEAPGDGFENDGILTVDVDDLDTSEGAKHGEKKGKNGSSERTAIASWTLRAAYTAWKKPPKITYKGSLKVKGKVKLNNANLSQVTISGGPPLQGTVACPLGPGTATVPVTISSASGSANIESQNAELEISTDGYPDSDNFEIELIAQTGATLPWCVKSSDAETGDDVDPDESFIKAGDIALCMAFGNSLDNLYVVDILR